MIGVVAVITASSLLVTLVLEVRDGRMAPMLATADGGIAIGVAGIVCRAAGVI